MSSILIHVRCSESIDDFKRLEKNGYNDDTLYSKEVRFMIEEFKSNGWNVYVSSIECFNNGTWNKVLNVNEDKIEVMDINDINNKIDVMIIRVLGSVEHQFNMIHNYLEYLSNNYKGIAINNPKTMLKGMTKHYLCEIDADELSKIGIRIINSKIFDNTVSYKEICDYCKTPEEYLLKPVCGELSYSVKNIASIDEDYLRKKEDRVHGWVVQPIMNEIYDGEYQMSFLNGKLIYSQKKNYPVKENGVPNQEERIIGKYHPTDSEIQIMESVINYFKNLYNIEIHICRTDFMKDSKGTPILLEFEMVNPGFFIGYMEENDSDIKIITSNIRLYCERLLKSA